MVSNSFQFPKTQMLILKQTICFLNFKSNHFQITIPFFTSFHHFLKSFNFFSFPKYLIFFFYKFKWMKNIYEYITPVHHNFIVVTISWHSNHSRLKKKQNTFCIHLVIDEKYNIYCFESNHFSSKNISFKIDHSSFLISKKKKGLYWDIQKDGFHNHQQINSNTTIGSKR